MRPSRRHLRRGVIVLPSAFTLGNLFLGFWAMISASRGEFALAAWLIVIAAVVDMLDGRIARFTSTGSDFGEQIDSLVDAISFGVAPAVIFYFLFLREGIWSWTLAYNRGMSFGLLATKRQAREISAPRFARPAYCGGRLH